MPDMEFAVNSLINAIEDLNRKNKSKATISKNADEAVELIELQTKNTLNREHFLG